MVVYVLPAVVFAVPDEDLSERVLLERFRGIRAEEAAGQTKVRLNWLTFELHVLSEESRKRKMRANA
jgi:hypothetical protein